MSQSHDPFDDLLRTTMRRRPEASAPDDLAARAIQMAQARPATIEPHRLWRFRLMAQLASLAAVILIGVFIYFGVRQLALHQDLTLTPGNTYTEYSSATATDSSTAASASSSSDSSRWTWIMMVGVVGLTGLGAAAAMRPSPPFAGAAGMARFA
jgi:Ca2+/H+ antiporter